MVANKFELPQVPPKAGGGGCDPNSRCGNGLEKIYPTCAVRYGYMRFIGEFSYAPGVLFGCQNKVVVQTDRGTEIGEQVSLTCTGCEKSVNRDQMRAYAKNSGTDFFRLKNGRILRVATPSDLLEDRKLHEEGDEKLDFARKLVRERKIPMKLVTCEQLFGGERVVFYFMADDRIDFRDLVRDLAHEYHTRIDMRQIGHRDEARLVADYEICGRECCCKNFLKTLRPVSMQMAKLQKSTLDPSKVSGRCGRLRCCLRYEHEGYEELTRKLPRAGSRVRVADGPATVVDRQILTQLVMLEFDSGKRMTFPLEDLLERDLPKPPPPQQQQQQSGSGPSNANQAAGNQQGGARGPNRGRPQGRGRPQQGPPQQPGQRPQEGRQQQPRRQDRPPAPGRTPPPPPQDRPPPQDSGPPPAPSPAPDDSSRNVGDSGDATHDPNR